MDVESYENQLVGPPGRIRVKHVDRLEEIARATDKTLDVVLREAVERGCDTLEEEHDV